MSENLVSFLNGSDINQDTSLSHFEIPKWAQTLQLVFMILLCGVGLLGNGLVAIIQTRLKDKSSTDYLVLTMALLDLFCSTCVTPFYMAQNIQAFWELVFSSTFCKLKYFIIYGTNISSTMLFSALAFDRYMRTCHPFSSRYTCSKSKILCVIIILIGISMAVMSFHVFDQNEALDDCVKAEDTRVMETIMNSCLTGAFVLLFGMVVFCYTKVTLKIRERAKVRNHSNVPPLRKSRSPGRKFRLFRQKKVEPLPLVSGTRPSKQCSVFEPGTSSSKKPALDTSRSCSADSANGANTGNDVIVFGTQIDRKFRNTSAYITLTPTALDGLTPRQNYINATLKNSYTGTKKENFKENILCSHKNLSKSCRQSRDFLHQISQDTQQETCPPLKQGKQQQQHEQQSEDSSVVSEREKREIRKVNYVTFMMFIITATYVITWVSAWLLYAIFNQTTITGRVVLYLTRTSFAVNYIANPIFFTVMSAKFRERARNLICCRK